MKVTHCPSTREYVLRITRLGRTTLNCYSVIIIVIGYTPFMEGNGGIGLLKKWYIKSYHKNQKKESFLMKCQQAEVSVFYWLASNQH